MLNPKQNQSGYLLLETLITVGILAVGLLGISAMQVMSLKSSYSAVQRGEAAYLIAALSDSMRANPQGVRRGFYNGLTANGSPDDAPERDNPLDVAQYDVNVWQQNIDATFGDASAPEGSITCPSRWNCILEINWLDTRAESQLQTESLQDDPDSAERYNHIASVVF